MLSAAHVLAMDAKNLLDVIDSIRIRHPYVNDQICQKQNDPFVIRGSTSENKIRPSQSGEHLLMRSQSSERQGSTFRQSQSGDILHRMGQSVDRSLQVYLILTFGKLNPINLTFINFANLLFIGWPI